MNFKKFGLALVVAAGFGGAADAQQGNTISVR